MGTDLYGASINIFDPTFGPTTDDAQTAPQMALIALGSIPGAMDSYPEFGFDFDGQVGRALDPVSLSMLPQEVEQGLLAEPAFVDARAMPTAIAQTEGGGVSVALQIQITGAEGNAVGFTLASG